MLSTPPETRRRRPGRGRVRLALLIITALALITIDFRGGSAGTAREGALDVLGPFRSITDTVTSPFRNAWQGITGYDELEEENARLQAQLDEALGETLEIAELQRRLGALEQLLDVRGTETQVDRVVARVIDAPLSNFERTIEIDRGRSDGVAVGMPVEAGAGLVGRVVQVGQSRARVELITDAQFAAGVRLVRSADAGVVEGRGAGELLTVSFVDLETVVVPGETVVTSGLEGSQFPSGIVVGTVVTARPDPVTGTQEVDVAPTADLERLSLVQVVLFEPTPIDNRPVTTTTTPTEDTTVDDPTPTDPEVLDPGITEPDVTEPTTGDTTGSTETTVPQVQRPGTDGATTTAPPTTTTTTTAPPATEVPVETTPEVTEGALGQAEPVSRAAPTFAAAATNMVPMTADDFGTASVAGRAALTPVPLA